MRSFLPIFIGLLVLGGEPLALYAQTAPRLLPFQGRLTDSSGAAVADGVKLVQFKIFDVPVGGSPVWAGELHRTTVNGGLVNVLLGSKTPFTGVDFDRQLYLEITVDIDEDDTITAADPPLLPRQAILPVVFAKEAADSRNLAGHDWTPLFGVNDPTGALLPSKVADGTLPGSKLAPASVTAGQIASNAVSADAIADHAVGSSKLADGALSDRHVGVLSHLTASDGTPSKALVIDSDGRVGIGIEEPREKLDVDGYINANGGIFAHGVTAAGPAHGEFSFTGYYQEGRFVNWLGSGEAAACTRLLGANGSRSGGFGMAFGNSIVSPVVWFYGFEDRNCFQVRAVNYDFTAGRSGTVPEGTPLLTVRRIGGGARVGIGTENPSAALEVNGSVRAQDFLRPSDRNLKTNFAPIDADQLLEKISEISIQSWSFTNEPPTVRHIGPTAQDFHSAFGLGDDDKHIATVDADGVALAAIQGLYRLLKEKDARIASLEASVNALALRLDEIVSQGTASKQNQSGTRLRAGELICHELCSNKAL